MQWLDVSQKDNDKCNGWIYHKKEYRYRYDMQTNVPIWCHTVQFVPASINKATLPAMVVIYQQEKLEGKWKYVASLNGNK